METKELLERAAMLLELTTDPHAWPKTTRDAVSLAAAIRSHLAADPANVTAGRPVYVLPSDPEVDAIGDAVFARASNARERRAVDTAPATTMDARELYTAAKRFLEADAVVAVKRIQHAIDSVDDDGRDLEPPPSSPRPTVDDLRARFAARQALDAAVRGYESRLSTPAAEVRVPNLKELCRVFTDECIRANIPDYAYHENGIEAVARACLAPIVEVSPQRERLGEIIAHLKIAVEMAKLEAPDGSRIILGIGHKGDNGGALVADMDAGPFANDLDALLTTIDSLAGVGT